MAPRNNQRNTPAQRPAQRTVQTNAGPNPMGRAAQSKPTSLGKVLKIAGGGQGIGGGELKRILGGGGKNVSGGQVVKRLDKVNERLAANDMTGINLKSGAANYLTRQATKNPTMDSFYKYGGEPTFGTGKIGQALQGMVGTRATGGYQGKDGYIGGASPAVARTILPRGMDLMPSGRQTVRGIGKQFTGMPTSTTGPNDGMMDNLTGNDQGLPPPPDSSSMEPEILPELPPEEEAVPQMGPSLDEAIANWAAGFKTARSSRKRSGPRAQGLASQLVNPTGGFRGGV